MQPDSNFWYSLFYILLTTLIYLTYLKLFNNTAEIRIDEMPKVRRIIRFVFTLGLSEVRAFLLKRKKIAIYGCEFQCKTPHLLYLKIPQVA